jgi:alpha-glucosidase (family GH31 glycosyl hydrolase)
MRYGDLMDIPIFAKAGAIIPMLKDGWKVSKREEGRGREEGGRRDEDGGRMEGGRRRVWEAGGS